MLRKKNKEWFLEKGRENIRLSMEKDGTIVAVMFLCQKLSTQRSGKAKKENVRRGVKPGGKKGSTESCEDVSTDGTWEKAYFR